MKRIFLIIKAGKSFESIISKYGDFDEFTLNAFPNKLESVLILNAQDLPNYPKVEDLYGVVITGAHQNTTDDEPWMIHLKQWIKSIHKFKLPVLGICFGHQIIAEALGGVVGFNPNGGEVGVVEVKGDKESSYLLKLPDMFCVFASHFQSVVKLPVSAISIAGNSIEPNHVVLYSDSIWGLQFHPEFNRVIIKIHQQENAKLVEEESNLKYDETEKFGSELLDSFYKICLNFNSL